MKILKEGSFTGERALYGSRDVQICDSVFFDGESPLKESRGIELHGCIFKWKYPLWYCKDVTVSDCTLLETARSGIWYTESISISDSTIEAPKTFRRAKEICLDRCTMPNAQETLWNCSDVKLRNVDVKGDYFGMGSERISADGLVISGNYAFDGAKDIEIRNARLISKDAFWNCENVTVYDSVIIGEYLAWNSKNVRFVNCTVESNQGMCYVENLVLENCKVINTDLAFELATVEADVTTHIISVKNPISGKIKAPSIGEIILDKSIIDPDKTEIITEE